MEARVLTNCSTPIPQRRDRAVIGAAARPVRSGSGSARHYAALDLGTNNCRLLIARPQGSGFTVIDAFSRIVRLGEGLALTGRLSEAAIERTIAALCICADKLRRRNIVLSHAVATQACRQATNGAKFIARVRQETGIALDVITAEKEARLAVLGCHALIEPGDSPALIFDIGGGSTELALIDTGAGQPQILDWYSAPLGVVSLSELFGSGASGTGDGVYLRMRAEATDSFRPFFTRLVRRLGAKTGAGAGVRLLGTSGTVTTLASVHLGLTSYNRLTIDGLILPAATMRAVSRDLVAMTGVERSAMACVGPERADLVVAGCAILDTILDLWPADRLAIADRGIREGILRRLMYGVEV